MKDLIEEIKALYQWLVKFITVDIWHINIDDFSRARGRFIKYLKVAIITVREAGSDKLGLYAVSLSFFSAMAVIPFAALAFVVTGGLGIDLKLKTLLLENFSDNQEVINWVIKFADNIVQTAQQGLFGFLSFLSFVWIVIWLILNIEKSFNEIWKVERMRSIAKRFLYYFGILLTAPFIITIFLSLFSLFGKSVEYVGFEIRWWLFSVIILFLFTAMYKYIPSVKVHFSAAFNAALITTVAYVVVQYLYVETQLLVSRLNAVYGIFAAVPLFLIWINISWLIILVGAEISHAFQYVNSYNISDESFSELINGAERKGKAGKSGEEKKCDESVK